MKTVEEINDGLSNFYGTENYWKNDILKFQYTDGVKFLWESCDAYWLLIAISSYNRKEHFQSWILTVNDDNSAVLKMQEDKGEPWLVQQEIPFTDFPLKEINLWLIDGILILPSEY